jgi:2-iminoacetate synthase ThiH
VSGLVDRAIDAAGLAGMAAARRAGSLTAADLVRLREADLLALGALADLVRRDEVGDWVRIFAFRSGESSPLDHARHGTIVLPSADRQLTGLELLREVAIARISGPRAAAVRVDWTRCGLELAQVTLGFGADELVGPITSKRGLPIAEGELAGVGKKSRWQHAHVQKVREIAALVRRAGRTPVFVESDGSVVFADEPAALQEAEAPC